MQSAPQPPTRILRKPDVVDRTGLSGTTLLRLIRENKFPRPLQLSLRAVGWKEIDIEAWLTSREVRR